MKPRGLRWREDGSEVLLTPHWGHSVAAGIILVFNALIFTALAMRPNDGKHFPWYVLVYSALVGVAVVAWSTYPLWGKTRLSFEGGVFRVGKRVALTLGELEGFTCASTASGVDVVAVKRDGTRIALPLPIGNPLTLPSGRGAAVEAKQREHGREEAAFVAERLTELLATQDANGRN